MRLLGLGNKDDEIGDRHYDLTIPDEVGEALDGLGYPAIAHPWAMSHLLTNFSQCFEKEKKIGSDVFDDVFLNAKHCLHDASHD